MARKANPALIGAFVLGAAVLAVAALVVFGGGKFFRQTRTVVAYFEGSLKGMAIGAPVTFNGVKIGSVTDFKVIVDTQTATLTTPVYFDIDASRLFDASGKHITLRRDNEALKTLYEKGLRAQLEISSLVTGQLEIALNFHPRAPLRLTGLSKDVPEVPTIPSSIERLTKTLEKLPLDEMVATVRQALDAINKIVNSPEIATTLRDLSRTVASADKLLVAVNAEIPALAAGLNKTLESTQLTITDLRATVTDLRATIGRVGTAAETALTEYQALAAHADKQLEPLIAAVKQVALSADKALVQAERALGSADAAINEDSPLRYDLVKALRELQAAARSLRALTDYLDRHPESVISGKRAEGTR